MPARGAHLPLDEDPANRYLPWVVALMVYLAALALAGAFVLGASAARWQSGQGGRLTVQVPPAELEGLLLEHPAVADAAVIGIPDVESGEVPKAFVVKKQGEEPSPAEIMDFVAGKVASFKRIKVVEFIDAIPKNPSGKILRRVLVEQERGKSGG
ncbi:MAG: hypothetical protein IIA73_06155 [Proteobacteria bacterium]|nr:hypothetical protein [Pseudomonadota bacterium]